MLHRVTELRGDHAVASDGDVGSLDDLYFDERRWGISFMVLATGPWLVGRKVLVPPEVVQAGRPLRVRLSRGQVQRAASPGPDDGAAHVVSSAELIGYALESPDGASGQVEDFVVDDERWEVADLVVATHRWLPGGRRVLVAPTAVARIDRAQKRLQVRLSRDVIRNPPQA